MAGIERRRGGTVLLTDAFVFVFLALGISAGSRFAASSKLSVVVFTIVWMSAAITRLRELRRGERPAIRLRCLDLRTTAILAIGSGPWLILGILQHAYPSWIIWKPIDVPSSLRVLGIALAIVAIAEPFLASIQRSIFVPREDRAADSTFNAYRFSSSVTIRSGAILLLSGSPVFALLCALWLGVTLWAPADPVSDDAGLPATSVLSPLPHQPALTGYQSP